MRLTYGCRLYRFGVGKPIGSMDDSCLSSTEELPSLYGKGGPRPCIVTPHQGSVPHAVFYDVTHDNETPHDKRTAEDALSTGALVTFTKAALGSNKGFDDLYPKLLNLVTDNRLYEVNPQGEGGIGKVKRVLNHLHTEMMSNGFTEGHVHEEGEVSLYLAESYQTSADTCEQYILVHRVHPITHKGYMLIAHTAFPGFKGRGWSEFSCHPRRAPCTDKHLQSSQRSSAEQRSPIYVVHLSRPTLISGARKPRHTAVSHPN